MIQTTTLKSYESNIRPRLTSLHAQIRRLLRAYPEGLTNKEIAQLLRRDASTISGVMRPLVAKKKEVYEAAERRCRITGNLAKVWRLASLRDFSPTPAQSKPETARLFA